VKLRYTPRAAADLSAVLAYIDERSPVGAAHLKRRLLAIIDLLPQQPGMGRPTRRAGIRRIVANPYPYLIFYRATATEIVIHHIRHAARRPAP